MKAKHLFWVILFLSAARAMCGEAGEKSTAGNAAAEPAGKAVPLFNGKDLSGWVPMHGGEWAVEDGTIVGRNGESWTTNPEKSGSWLRSAREYSDFVFQFEFAINKGGNSGVFLRSALEKNPAFTGHEMQILDDHDGEPKVWSTGALYDVVAAAKNLSKPAGEWNQVKIEARGPRIKIDLNGEPIVDHRSDRRQRGYLGLQNHDAKAVVRFRNLQVTPLQEPARPANEKVIAYSMLSTQNPYFQRIAAGMEKAVAGKGAKIIAKGGRDSDVLTQIQQIQDFIVAGVDAIVITPIDARAIDSAIRDTNAAGIPVFTCDIKARGEKGEVVAHVATDNFAGGKLAAKAMAEALGKKGGEIVVLGFPKVEACLLRVKGFKDGTDELNKGRDPKKRLRIVGEADCRGTIGGGEQATDDALQAFPNLRGVFAINDPAALGARKSLEKHGKQAAVSVVGFDGQPEAKRAVKDGKLFATVVQSPETIGKTVAEAVLKHLAGEKLPPEILVTPNLYSPAEAKAE